MRTNFNRMALSDSQNGIIWSRYGEVLRVLDTSNVSMDYLINVLQRPVYTSRFRLFVLNPDETVDYEIPEEDIILNSGSFNENYQNGQRKSVNISLVNIDGKYTPNINSIWVHSKFRLDVGLEFAGGIYWFPRGIYILNNPDSNHNISDKQVSLNLVDKFAILEGKAGTLEATYEIPVGSDIKAAIYGILTLDNGAGSAIDLKPIIYDSVFEGRTMPYTLSKDAGSTLGEMLIEIGTILNAEIYYNSQGNLCVVDINETTLDIQKASLWDYAEDDGNYFNAVVNYDFENCVNEIHVVGDNVNNEIFSAVAKNNNPLSPLCIEKIGRRIEYINDSDIYSDSLAQQRADYELRKYSILKTMLNIQVSFNPLLFVNNMITITDDYYGFVRERFIIQSISYTIGEDCKMNINCSNVINFSDAMNAPQNIVSTYYRRLFVGDNLNNKTLRFKFPANIGDIIMSYPYVSIDEEMAFQTDGEHKTVTQGVYTRSLSQINYAYVEYGNGTNNIVVYNDDPINTSNNVKLTSLRLGDDAGTIVAITDDNECIYDYIYMDDDRIRPIKVGDDLRGATVYFNFPREIHDYVEDIGDVGIIKDTNGTYMFSTSVDGSTVDIGGLCYDSSQELSLLQIYSYNKSTENVTTNLGRFVYDPTTLDSTGVVLEILNPQLAQYILVDVSTMNVGLFPSTGLYPSTTLYPNSPVFTVRNLANKDYVYQVTSNLCTWGEWIDSAYNRDGFSIQLDLNIDSYVIRVPNNMTGIVTTKGGAKAIEPVSPINADCNLTDEYGSVITGSSANELRSKYIIVNCIYGMATSGLGGSK